MNCCYLVEGRQTEKKVYRAWLGHVFPDLVEAETIGQLAPEGNHYVIVTGGGYPSYLSTIGQAIRDAIDTGNVSQMFVCVDAENETAEDRRSEISNVVEEFRVPFAVHIVVHNCCIETWFLGHGKMLRRNPQSEGLRRYKRFYDVSQNDPELMSCPADVVVKAPFHCEYLKEMLREQNLRYTKVHPGVVMDRSYLAALAQRWQDTRHIGSFGSLLEAWRELGGAI